MILDRLLEELYLRAYAKNMDRSYRSDPANAASDAQVQISTMILIAGFTLLIIVGSTLFPVFLGRFLKGDNLMYGTMIGVALVVVFGVNWRFRGYEKTPELARPFATVKSRRGSLILYWGVMVVFLVVVWVVLGLKRRS